MPQEPTSQASDVSSPRTITAIETQFAIIEQLRNNEGSTVTEIANELSMAKSSVHAHLTTLCQYGCAVKDDSEYSLGLSYLDLGIRARDQIPGSKLISDKARDLAEETGELVSFLTEQNNEAVIVFRERGENSVDTQAREGAKVPLHVTAAGKSIMAHLPEERVDEIIAKKGLTKFTDNSITSEDELKRELERIKERGYGINNGEHTPRAASVSAPILNQDGDVLGSMSISTPKNRMETTGKESKITKLLLGVTNEIELRIEFE